MENTNYCKETFGVPPFLCVELNKPLINPFPQCAILVRTGWWEGVTSAFDAWWYFDLKADVTLLLVQPVESTIQVGRKKYPDQVGNENGSGEHAWFPEPANEYKEGDVQQNNIDERHRRRTEAEKQICPEKVCHEMDYQYGGCPPNVWFRRGPVVKKYRNSNGYV